MNEDWFKRYELTLPECSICYEPINTIDEATLKCGHKLHKRCLAIWAGDPKNNPSDRNKTCPICRGPLELKLKQGMLRREIGGYRKKKTVKIRKSRKSRKLKKPEKIYV